MAAIARQRSLQLNQVKVTQRTCLKCDQCRNDSKKCTPAVVSLESPSNKCERCQRLGHACGPLRRAHTYKTSSSGRFSRFGTNLQQFLGTSQAYKSKELGSNHSTGLCRLANVVGAGQFLFRQQCELTAIRPLSPPNAVLDQQGSLLQNLASKLEREFESTVDSLAAESGQAETDAHASVSLLSDCLQDRFNMFQLQLSRFHSTHDGRGPIFVSCKSWRRRLCPSLSSFNLLACTERAASEVNPGSLRVNKHASSAGSHLREQYIEASAELDAIMKDDIPRLPTSSQNSMATDIGYQIHGKVPASHLAYWNFDKDVAFDLATQNGLLALPVNMFNQNLIHLAVKMSDIGFLKRLADEDGESFAKALGVQNHLSTMQYHTPLQLARIIGDNDIVCLLAARSTEIRCWSKVLPGPAVTVSNLTTTGFMDHDMAGRLVNMEAAPENNINEEISYPCGRLFGIEQVSVSDSIQSVQQSLDYLKMPQDETMFNSEYGSAWKNFDPDDLFQSNFLGHKPSRPLPDATW